MALPLNLDSQLSLRWLFAGHFAFTALVLFGDWPGIAYVFYNGFLLALLIWAEITPPTAADSETPLLKCVLVEGAAVFFDVLLMSTRYYSGYHGLETFALIMAVFHFIARFPACFLLWRIREDRRGVQYGTTGGGGGGGGGLNENLSPGAGGYEEFPPSHGAGGFGGGHDTKPLPP